MGLTDLFRGELLEIIEWLDDSRDTLAWRFPDEDKAIKNGAQLIVRESQVAQLVMTGQFADTFWQGKHTLSTPNVPVLARLQGWKYGFVSPFKVDIYYVSTRLFTGNKWGTSNPVMMRDQDFGVVRLRAFGTFDFKVVNPQLFLKEVVGTDQNFRIDEFARAAMPSPSLRRPAPRNAANSAVRPPLFPSRQPVTRSHRQPCSQPSSPSRRFATGFVNGTPRGCSRRTGSRKLR
jgi:membrane protease subunit (stomatin/prohibitin family)